MCILGYIALEIGTSASLKKTSTRVQLVFYSTFEPVDLPGGGPMEAVGVQKLYEPSPTPILFVGLAANVLRRVPVMPLFLLLG